MKRSQSKILDSLLHDIIVYRDGGVCKKCGRKGSMQVSHIYSKSAINHQNMRYLPENCLSMCMHCHLHWWHKDPICAYEWYVQNVDENRRLVLATEAMKPSKQMFGGDYEKTREYLLEEFEKIKNNK